MSSTAIVYYSLEGNTSYVAGLLAQKTGAEIIKLETVKEYPKNGFLKFFCGGRDATFGIRPELKNAFPDFSQFSTIIIGTPVWAGKPSAPVNAFLHKAHITGKRIALFACCGGGSTVNCFSKMKKKLEGNRIIAEETFITPALTRGETVSRKIDMLAAKL
jgi:flavodoxin